MAKDTVFELSPEEKEVVTYHCSTLGFPRCNGYLTVTNNRVIFHGQSRKSRIVQEVELNTVSGLNTFYGGKLRWGLLLIGIVALIAAVAVIAPDAFSESVEIVESASYYYPTSRVSTFHVLLAIVFALIGFVCLANCYRKAFFLQIYSSQSTGSPIRVGQAPTGGIGSGAVFSIVAFPTPHTDNMMLELGALIQDLKKLGDRAIDRWHKKWYGILEEESSPSEANESNPTPKNNSQGSASSQPRDNAFLYGYDREKKD